jgi:hypothetical protein
MTELITNAVLHANSEVRVVVAVADGVLEVGVADHGPTFQRAQGLRPVPAQRAASSEELGEHGRGLLLVEHIADQWGVEERGDGKQVWFRISVARTWPYAGDCDCAIEALNRARLGSGAFAVAMTGPWDEPQSTQNDASAPGG